MPVPEDYPIQPFLDTLKFEKRYSPHTLRSYRDDLVQFYDFLYAQFGKVSLEEISSSMIRTWLASLKDLGMSAKSINRKISSLKSFFRNQLLTGVLSKTPMTPVRSPKIPKRLPVYVQQSEMETPAVMPQGFDGYTHRLLISIFYATGLRLAELINLKENDVDYYTRSLKVLGKGRKERIIPLGSALLTEIAAYKTQKTALPVEADRLFLLVTPKGSRIYPKYAYRAVTGYLSQVTTLSKKSPHVLRHSFATHLTNNGAELNAVKELLGHSSLAATQVYTHNSIDRLKEIHERAHPKS